MSVIKVEGLTKDYGNHTGIFDLNFSVADGEVFGYLGPNGAGKTTTIRHLLGFLNAQKGKCSIGAYDCRRDAAYIQKDLGYIPGEIAFFDEFSGMEFLEFMADMRGMKDDTKMKELLEFFELDASGRIKKMSKGMKQKIAIVTAFMHNPTTLILDEPTSGLDPLMQEKFVQLILREKKEGKTILMSSHSFEEVEKTCDKVGIIREGSFVAMDSVESLKKSKRKLYKITLSTLEEAQSFAKEELEVKGIEGKEVTVSVKGGMKPLTKAMDKHDVLGIDVVSQSLEEIFMTYYGGEKND